MTERCEVCNGELSPCGELNVEGTPSSDCRVCQLTAEVAAMREALKQIADLQEKIVTLRWEVERAFNESWHMAWDSPHGTLHDAYHNSRARRVVEGEEQI